MSIFSAIYNFFFPVKTFVAALNAALKIYSGSRSNVVAELNIVYALSTKNKKRKCKIIGAGDYKWYAKTMKTYTKYIIPWLEGDPNALIKYYNDICEEIPDSVKEEQMRFCSASSF